MASRYRFLLFALLVLPLFRGFADEPTVSRFAKWEKEISAFEAKDREHPPQPGDIVFIGSSSIRMWSTLEQDFPKHRVVNRGFGGSEIEDSTYFADRIIYPHAPRMIVMYAGGNDINAGKLAARVADDFRAFVEKVRKKFPDVQIAYISIAGNPKRWAQVEKVKDANARIKEYCGKVPGLKYIDTYSAMLGSDGLPKPDIFRDDKLHMNAEGYKIWTANVGPELGKPDR
jgi:lysophospholipase L1-like esterase